MDEIEEQLTTMSISVVMGSLVYNNNSEQLQQVEQQCGAVKQILFSRPGLVHTFICTGIHDQITSRNDVDSTLVRDYREQLARHAYATLNTDFYMLFDLFLRPTPAQSLGWIMPPIVMLLHSTLYRGFGVSVYDGDVEQSSVWYPPMQPVLQRSHFELFDASLWPSVLLPSAPPMVNNFLLLDIYRPFDGCVHFGSVASIFEQIEAKRVVNEVRAQLPAIMESYAERLEAARRALGASLSTGKYSEAPLSHEIEQEMAINIRDSLFEVYCAARSDGSSDRHRGAAEVPSAADQASESIIFDMTVTREVGCRVLSSNILGSMCLDSSNAANATASTDSTTSGDSIVDSVSQSARDNVSTAAHDIILVSEGTWQVKFRAVPPSSIAYQNDKHRARIAVITAIYGNYERTAKCHARQTRATDFIVFTDRAELQAPGWIVVTAPLHLEELQRQEILNQSLDNNAFARNMHPFNIAKYYKQHFHSIPLLAEYAIVIWVDGTVMINDEEMSDRVWRTLYGSNETMMVFEHARHGQLQNEAVLASGINKYTSTMWAGHAQPVQNIMGQLLTYQAAGYRDEYWSELMQSRNLTRPNYGVWCTCFVAWNMLVPSAAHFLSTWWEHNRLFTTEDQVSFPFVSQSLGIHPHSLPDEDIYGSFDSNSFYIKMGHGV